MSVHHSTTEFSFFSVVGLAACQPWLGNQSRPTEEKSREATKREVSRINIIIIIIIGKVNFIKCLKKAEALHPRSKTLRYHDSNKVVKGLYNPSKEKILFGTKLDCPIQNYGTSKEKI